MKRKATVRPKASINASVSVTGHRQVKALINSLKESLNIVESMDDATYQEVISVTGKSFYQDLLDSIQDLSSIR